MTAEYKQTRAYLMEKTEKLLQDAGAEESCALKSSTSGLTIPGGY